MALVCASESDSRADEDVTARRGSFDTNYVFEDAEQRGQTSFVVHRHEDKDSASVADDSSAIAADSDDDSTNSKRIRIRVRVNVNVDISIGD